MVFSTSTSARCSSPTESSPISRASRPASPTVSATSTALVRSAVLGEPNASLSTRTELRFGNNGSVSVVIAGEKRGEWYDHEEQVGGGPRELIREKRGIPDDEVPEWLRRELGIVLDNQSDKGRSGGRRIVEAYDYRDERGALLFDCG